VGAVWAGAGCCAGGVWSFFRAVAGGDGAERAGGYGDGFFGETYFNYAYYGYKLSAGGESGLRICVLLSDDTALSDYDDHFGDGV
jgi:hypothetical protein